MATQRPFAPHAVVPPDTATGDTNDSQADAGAIPAARRRPLAPAGVYRVEVDADAVVAEMPTAVGHGTACLLREIPPPPDAAAEGVETGHQPMNVAATGPPGGDTTFLGRGPGRKGVHGPGTPPVAGTRPYPAAVALLFGRRVAPQGPLAAVDTRPPVVLGLVVGPRQGHGTTRGVARRLPQVEVAKAAVEVGVEKVAVVGAAASAEQDFPPWNTWE